MDSAMELLKWVHAGLGVVCLLSGTVALASRKAAGRHPTAGRVFAVALMLVYLSILFNIVMQRNVFMLGIGGLAVYAGVDGWRALRRFKGTLPPTAQTVDKLAGGVTALLSLALAAFGAHLLLAAGNLMGAVCVGFALLGVGLLRGAAQRFRTPPPKEQWLAAHIGLMTGAFSAAITAFFAVQLSGRLGAWEWVLWVAPSVLMSTWARREQTRRGLREAS